MSFSTKNPHSLREREGRNPGLYCRKPKIKKKSHTHKGNNVTTIKKALKNKVVLNGKIDPRRCSSRTINNSRKLPQISNKLTKTVAVNRGEVSVAKSASKSRGLKRKAPLGVVRHILPGKWASSKDKKLVGIPFVEITSNCRGRAEAVMKLRKVLPKKLEKREKRDDISDSEEEEESDGGEESSVDEAHATSSSDAETGSDRSEDEEVFHNSKPKSYPLRRKSVKSPITGRRRTETPTRAGSASDSSSESLLDIPPPTCGSSHKWNYTSSTTVSKPVVSKSPKRIEDKSTSSNKSGARALRSKSTDVFTHALDALQFARAAAAAESAAAATNKTPKKNAKPLAPARTSPARRSPSRSPERDRLLRCDKPHSSKKSNTSAALSDKAPELEKSYSFRHLENKISIPHSIQKPKTKKLAQTAPPMRTTESALSSISITTKPSTTGVDSIIPIPVVDPALPPPKKKPGRPRKDKSILPVILSAEFDVPPAKRTRRTTSNELAKSKPPPTPIPPVLDKIPKPSSTMEESVTPKIFPVPRKFPDPSKQQRDAIALRARQSKIMAKSRVLQSNKYSFNASWRKPLKRDDTPSSATKSETAAASDDDDDDQSSSSSGSASASGENSSSSDNQKNESGSPTEFTLPNPEIGSFKSSYKPKNMPVAKCEICNLTFTRKFSLTKHLATRQHQRMLRKRGIKQEPRKLRRERTEVKKQSQERESLENPDGNDLLGDENLENQAILKEEEEEEEEEEVKVQEWLSGRAVGVNNYVCDICGDIFIKKFDFAAHLWSHRAGSDLVCADCGLKFAESDKFNEHIDSAHVPDIKFSCKICPSKFNRQDYLLKHLQSHKLDGNEKLICSACDKTFSTHNLLSRHFDIKHLQLGKSEVQHVSDDTYSFPSHLQYARRSLAAQAGGYVGDEGIDNDNNFENHDPNDEEDEEEEEDDEYEDSEECDDDLFISRPQKGFVPTLSNRSRSSQSGCVQSQGLDVRTYLKRSWLYDNSIIGCGAISDERIPPFSYSPLCCKDCGKTFESRKLLVKHVDYVNHAERYMCMVCKKAFKWRYLLNRHMTRHSRGKVQLKKRQEQFSKMKPSFLKNREPSPVTKALLPKLLPIIPPKTTQPIPMLTATASSFDTKGLTPTATAFPRVGAASSTPKGTMIPIQVRVPVTNAITPTAAQGIKPKQSKLVTSATAISLPSWSGNKSTTNKKGTKDPLGPSISGSVGDQEVASTSSAAAAITSTSAPVTIIRRTTFEPKAGQGNKFFSCGLCSKSFTDKNTLTVHTWFHQSESLYSCPNCDAKCERKSDFELHFKCHETNQPFFLCYVCFKPFRWKKDMIRHVRKKHPDEKTYRCLYCNERFRINDELTEHISESHAKHRNYPCEYCGKRYAQKRYLLLHIRTQHGIGDGSGMEMEMEVNPDQYLLIEDMVEDGDADGGGTD